MNFVGEGFDLFVGYVLEKAQAVVWSCFEELPEFLKWEGFELAFQDVGERD